MLVRALVVASCLVALAGARADAAIPRASTTVDATFDPARGHAVGTVTLRIVNVTADPLGHASVWLYANRFQRQSPAVDDVNFFWVYPAEFNPGWTRIAYLEQRVGEGWQAISHRQVPHALAGEGTLVDLARASPVPPGQELVVRMAFETRVPARFGVFGCVDGDCTIAGGLWPQLATLDPAGWDVEAPPAVTSFHGVLGLTTLADVVAGGRATQDTARVVLSGRATHLPLRVAPGLHLTRGEQDGVQLQVWTLRPAPPAPDAARQIIPYTSEDYGRMTLDVAKEAVEVLGMVGLGLAPGTTLVFVESRLRQDLASPQPGVVYVSDRAFRIVPAKSFRKFHAREIVRALYAELLERRPRLPGTTSRDATVEPEASAAFLLDLFTLRQYRKSEFAQNLLAPVAFIPMVDQLIYAPQIAFAGAFFGGTVDRDEFRDDIRRFNNLRPRGFVYYEKLRDLLPAVVLADTMRDVALGRARLRDAAETHAGRPLGAFFAQWSGRAPRVDYQLAGIETRPVEGGRWRHTITVAKKQVAPEAPPVEPVQIKVVDDDGTKQLLRWDGEGERGKVSFDSAAEDLDLVQIDPASRVVQTAVAGDPVDPRFADRRPRQWKFLYNNLGFLFGSDGSVEVVADFSFRRIYDNRNIFRLQLFSNQGVRIGGVIGYSYRFGPLVTANRPLRSLSFNLGAQRLTDRVAGVPGARVSLSVGLGADDRLAGLEPYPGRGLGVVTRVTTTRFDDQMDAPRAGEVLVTGATGIGYTYQLKPADGHTVILAASAAAVYGDIGGRAQLLGAGGLGGLRGYGNATLFSRAQALGHVEWRGSLSHQMDMNGGHLIWWRGLTVAAFAEAGLLSSCETMSDLGDPDGFYASAGFGLRGFYDVFGVQGGFIGLDVATPFVRRSRACFDQPVEIRKMPPLLVYLTFVPPFS
jgi:hypothetical protein